MEVKIEQNNIIITLPISPRPSASNKSTVLASSNGNVPSTAIYEGKPVIVGVNCYVKKS